MERIRASNEAKIQISQLGLWAAPIVRNERKLNPKRKGGARMARAL